MATEQTPTNAQVGTEAGANEHRAAPDDTLTSADLESMLAQTGTATEEEPGSEDYQAPAEEATGEQVAGLDLSALDASQWQEIADHLNSRAADRIGGEISKRKDLEAQIEALKQQADTNPLQEAQAPEANPFHEIESVDDLKSKYSEVSEMIEWAEDLLDDHEDSGRNETIHEEDGTGYTKGDIRKMLRNARKARESHLPARFQQLQQQEQIVATRQQYRDIAAGEFQWMKDPENEVFQRYENVLSNPQLAALQDSMPELPLVLAHAADSIHRSELRKAQGQQPANPAPQAPARMRPPSNPSGSAAAPARAEPKPAQALQALQDQFDQTGDHKLLTEILSYET